jgi:hypothetical protein
VIIVDAIVEIYLVKILKQWIKNIIVTKLCTHAIIFAQKLALMTELIYFFSLLVSSLSILFVVVFFVKKNQSVEQAILITELKKQRQEFFLPNRVEAYQRAILFLERINPNSLVMRMQNPGLPGPMFQALLLKTIRDEYDHNVAQQLFISTIGWKILQDSKEETIKLINIASSKMEESTDSLALSSLILSLAGELDQLPTEIAIDFLKKEIQSLF